MKEEGESIIKYVLSKTNLIIHSKPCKAIQHNAKNKQEKGQSLATFNPNKKNIMHEQNVFFYYTFLQTPNMHERNKAMPGNKVSPLVFPHYTSHLHSQQPLSFSSSHTLP